MRMVEWLGALWKPEALVWRGFARSFGGDVLKRKGRVRGVFIRRGSWEMVVHRHAFRLPSGTRWHTRASVCCQMQQPLFVKLESADVLGRILRWFGRMAVTIGDPEIERAFVIGTNNPKLLKQLLRDSVLRQQIRSLQGVWIELLYEADYDENLIARSGPLFRCHVPRKMKTLSALRHVTDATMVMVSRLEALGIISPRPTTFGEDVTAVPLGGGR